MIGIRFSVALSLILLSAAAGCSRREPLPMLGSVPDFTLQNQTGNEFHGSTLRGHVWVADFIYTTCPGPCPLMSRRMRRIADATASKPGIRLVSFTVDPAHDTPPVLATYGKRFGVDAARWSLLTGDSKTLEMLDRDAFKLGDLDTSMNHSTRFVLVDQQGRIRAYYGMGQEHMLEKVVSDAEFLSKQVS